MPRAAGDQQRRGQHHQTSTHDVGPGEHCLPSPAVEQDTREGADQAVGKQQNHESRRGLARIGLVLGVEEDRAGQRGLKDAVRQLRDGPGAVQGPEPWADEQPPNAVAPPHLMTVSRDETGRTGNARYVPSRR